MCLFLMSGGRWCGMGVDFMIVVFVFVCFVIFDRMLLRCLIVCR